MRPIRCVAVALLGFVLAGGAAYGQATPYFTNVSFADGKVRATLVNPRPTALTAWAFDVIDAGGRPIVSQTADAIELPSEFVPAYGQREVEFGVSSPAAVAIVFRAGITANGEGVGELEIVGRFKERREQRAAAKRQLVQR